MSDHPTTQTRDSSREVSKPSYQPVDTESILAGETLRLFAMFIMGMSVGICVTLFWVDIL